ncbi:MAG: hypothetical protein AAFX39_00715 [Pseudomonadota bacterium]
MKKISTLALGATALATATLTSLQAQAAYCYYEYYWDAWGNYVYAYVCY